MYDKETERFGSYSSYEYEYYLDGNRLKETDNIGRTKEYTYDGSGRLKSERYDKESGIDSWVNVYSYDARGNRISKITKKGTSGEIDLILTNTEVSPASISNRVNIEDSEFKPYIPEAPLPDLTGWADYSVCTYVYNERNELISSNWYDNGYMNRITDYSYDSNGNMIYKKVKQYFDNYAPEDATIIEYPDEYTYYSYNMFNQLTKVKRNNVETTYVYDPQKERIRKTVDGISTNYVWDDAGNIVMEYGTQGEKIYNRGAGGEIISDGENYFAYNGHGDTTNLVRQSSDTAVEITAAYEYDAFGNAEALGGEAIDNPYRYNGQQADEESGLIYLRNRYYDPEIGRFISEDPYWNVNNMIYGNREYEEDEMKIPDYSAIVQSANLYVYCMNDPVNGVDPNGTIDWREASDIIRRNAWAIKNAGSYYGVNPAILAGCIYTELTWNYNWIDDATDLSLYFLDTSIGIAQVKVSTARMLEDNGYIARTEFSGIVMDLWYAPGVGYVDASSRDEAIAIRLTSESESINYAAAYLSYIQNLWKGAYPEIDGRSAILGTLYNIGEYGSRGINSNPESTPFGENVKSEYYYMRELLGL